MSKETFITVVIIIIIILSNGKEVIDYQITSNNVAYLIHDMVQLKDYRQHDAADKQYKRDSMALEAIYQEYPDLRK